MNNVIVPSIYKIDLDLRENISCLNNIFKNKYLKVVHFDVMDGVFSRDVFNGLMHLEKMRDLLLNNNIIVDIHLVVKDPIDYLKKIIDLNTGLIIRVSCHYESVVDIKNFLKISKNNNIIPGVSFKLKTNIPEDIRALDGFSFFNLICNDEENGLCNFQDEVINKIKKLSYVKKQEQSISVDCGLKGENIKLCVDGGAEMVIMGSAIFKTESPSETLSKFYKIANDL